MKSLIALSMHKAGSTIADQIIVDFCIEKGYELDRISKKVPVSSLPERDIFINYQPLIQATGVYYGMARGPYVKEMPVIDRLKAIVHVRDPRDCLTSSYFSSKHSHVPPKNAEKLKIFQKKRDSAASMTIDEYVKARSNNYLMRMSVLMEIIERHSAIKVVRYEDMVDATDNWLSEISSFIEQPLTESLRSRLGDKVNFRVNSEDISRHKRQVTPGDHRRKLRPDTIASVNESLEPCLRYFGYEFNDPS